MKPYGQKRQDHGCCPGHDKFPGDTYATKTSKHARARDKQAMHQIARARAKAEINSGEAVPAK